MITNNSISVDTQGERIERLTLLEVNIGAVAVEIGVAGTRLAAAQTSGADYLGAIANAGVQDGQTDEAFETFHLCVDDLTKLYSASKEHLLSIIWELEKPDDFIEAYGFRGSSPYRHPGLLAKIDMWKDNHDVLTAALDERVLSAAAMANLIAKRNEMAAFRQTAYVEKHEATEAYDALHELYDAHTKLMSFIYTAACLAWGDDDSRLNLLGFKPSSEVWTPGEPEPPEPGEEPPKTVTDPPTNFSIKEIVASNIVIDCTKHPDADGIDVFHATGPLGDDMVPEIPPIPKDECAPMPLIISGEAGFRNWVWVRQTTGGIPGEMSGPLWLDIE